MHLDYILKFKDVEYITSSFASHPGTKIYKNSCYMCPKDGDKIKYLCSRIIFFSKQN